ncbi:right-handed parallel beta-helix repeat-containing protein [Nonomuraea sp. NPDC059007]|uniref:right-handed parallel beta-helix repeat-containing protein n=1 Tax=Nonomuraea sp. NPDC059007 TaxID=3346692 RepID=UPI0036CC079F
MTVALALASAGFGASSASASAAPVYYLDSAAVDDSGAGTSPATAWKTLAKASAADLPAGARLLLRRGGSWTGQLAVTESGTAAAPIVIDAYGTGARPVVKGDGEACVDLAGNHLEVYNLQVGVDGDEGRCAWAGVKVRGDDNVVERNYITGAAAGVFIEEGTKYAAVTANEFVNNNHMSKNTPVPDNDDSGAFAILVHGDDSNIGWNTMKGSIAPSHDYVWDGAAVEIFYGSRNRVHHNISVDNDTFTELGTYSDDKDGVSTGNVFEYNAIYGAKGRGGLVTRGPVHEDGRPEPNGPVFATAFDNNSIHLTNPAAEGVVCDAGCTNRHLSMSQNIVHAAKKSAYSESGFTDNHRNVFFGGQYQMPHSPDSKYADPRFDPAHPLRLRAGSPAIGLGATKFDDLDLAGAAVGKDGAIEAGAYEY